ncbi:MAG: beta-propeller domain-containing protein, partial [Bradymonadaceae bacterium]
MKRQNFESTNLGSRVWRSALVTVVGATMLLGACAEPERGPNSNNGNNNVATSQFRLLPATSCEDIRERYIDATVEQALQSRYEDWGWAEFGEDGVAEPSAGETDGATRDEAPSDYTETNVQEVGVDEPDIVKTDGRFIYTTHGQSLVILKSWPADQTAEVGRVDFGNSQSADRNENVTPSSLFLRDDRVAVFSRIYDYHRNDGNRSFNGTRISILDVSDRTAPVLERQLDVEGWMVSARMIDGKVYLVSNSNLNVPFNYWDYAYGEHEGLPDQEWDADEARREELKDEARPAVRALVAEAMADVDIKETMPRRRIGNGAGEIISTESLYDCTDIYLTQQLAEMGILNITSFTLDNKTLIDSTGLMASGWLVYSSRDNLYVSMTSRSWWGWGWGNSQSESHIHKFELPASGDRPHYAASGRVDGWILNQFSMSEYEGYLRVATTDNQFEWNEEDRQLEDRGGNHLIVLKQNEGLLEETGSVRNLAPTEQIYAARMMGPKGYMVTFVQVDPLFTFDLSDPYDPKLLGELKIDGYSSYMHPLGEDHLLAIGMDGDENGIMSGVHLQIFDVSDMANPTRIHHHVISTGSWSSYSEALWNHHAFTYHAGHRALAEDRAEPLGAVGRPGTPHPVVARHDTRLD